MCAIRAAAPFQLPTIWQPSGSIRQLIVIVAAASSPAAAAPQAEELVPVCAALFVPCHVSECDISLFLFAGPRFLASRPCG